METLHFSRPGSAIPVQATLAGCVSSGDLEVMVAPSQGKEAQIVIRTSTPGSERRWQHLLDQLTSVTTLPVMRMDIHDFSATPGVIRLRIEQALEQAQAKHLAVQPAGGHQHD